MTAKEKEATEKLETYYFRFDPRAQPLLQRFSSLIIMAEQEASYLEHYGYQPLQHDGPLTLYRSETANDRFLVMLKEHTYRFVIHCPNEAAVVAFKKDFQEQFAFGSFHKLNGVLPEPPSDPYLNHQVIKLDPVAVRNRTNGYY